MGLKVNIAVFVVTVIMTITTSSLMTISILSEHWEVVRYDSNKIRDIITEKSSNGINTSYQNKKILTVEALHNGKVLLVAKHNGTIQEVMVQMHAGLWAVCYDLKGNNFSIYIIHFWGDTTHLFARKSDLTCLDYWLFSWIFTSCRVLIMMPTFN